MWKIHGKVYDLTEFLDLHPGGKAILECTKSELDITPAFESYHALSNMEKITNIMQKYEIGVCEKSDYTFKENGFYYTLKNRVRKILKNTKTDYRFIITIHTEIILFLYCYTNAFIFHNNLYTRLLMALISSFLWMLLGFTVMHNASHMALFKNNKLNNLYSYYWNELGLWSNNIWFQHHVYRHHSYTGNHITDPDQRHFKPIIRKNIIDSKDKYIKFFQKYILLAVPIIYIFPGMYFGQVQSYLRGKISNKFCGIKLINNRTFLSDIFLKMLSLYTLVYNFNIYVLLIYIIGVNICYSINIIPDHDMIDTAKNKLIKGDWGEVQVRNSGNFITNNYIYTYIVGGINYQIEHHLFPSLCSIYYPKIQNVVKLTCKEFNIPYVESNGLINANIEGIKNFIDIAKN